MSQFTYHLSRFRILSANNKNPLCLVRTRCSDGYYYRIFTLKEYDKLNLRYKCELVAIKTPHGKEVVFDD